MNDEARLVRKLLHNYDPHVRPLINSTDNITVKFGGTFVSYNIDEGTNRLDAELWLNFEFINEFFKWDPAHFGGVKDVRLPADLMWVPDISLYNDATGDFNKYLKMGSRPTLTVVESTGKVTWIPPTKASVACRFDEAAKQYMCSLKFGSWVYNNQFIDLQLNSENGLDLSSLLVHPKWDLVTSEGKLNTVYYECCPEGYVDITFDLVIKKKCGVLFC